MSKLFTLDLKDLLNGLLFAVIGDVVFYLLIIFGKLKELVLNNQPFNIIIDWKAVLVIGIFAGLTYLVKRYFSGSTGVIGKN